MQQRIKKIVHHDQVGFIHVHKDGSTYGNQSTSYTTLTKVKNHMIISRDAEKALDKVQHPFMVKIITKMFIDAHSLT